MIIKARSFIFTFIVLFKSFPTLSWFFYFYSQSVSQSVLKESACVICLVTLPSGIDLLSCELLYKDFVFISKLTFLAPLWVHLALNHIMHFSVGCIFWQPFSILTFCNNLSYKIRIFPFSFLKFLEYYSETWLFLELCKLKLKIVY